jgi:hypothetical protein
MTLPFVLPDWLPWWVTIVLLVPTLLYALALLFMPFSVIGVKSRLEVIEARLDEIQHEIRQLSLRLPDAGRAADFDDIYPPVAPTPSDPPRRPSRPPIPPAPRDYDGPRRGPPPESPLRATDRRSDPEPRSRAEPRFDWRK